MEQSGFTHHLAKLKQQDKLLQKIEQLKKQKEEGAREIRDLDAQKEILVKRMYSYKEEEEVKRQEEIRCLDLQKKILIEKMSEKDKKVVEKGKKDEEEEVKKEEEEGEKVEEVKEEVKEEEVKEEEKQKPKHSKGKGKNKSKNKGGRKGQGQSSGINEEVEKVEEVEGSMEDVKPSSLELDMKHVYVCGKIKSVTFKREKGQQFAIGRISDNSGEVDFKATGTDVTKLRTGSFFKLGNATAKWVNESVRLVSSGEIEEIPPIQVLIRELTPDMENIFVSGKVIHVTLRHEKSLLVAEGRLADKTGVVDFKAVGKKSAHIIKVESFFRFENIITEMNNGRMRVRSLGEISKLEIDPSIAAGFATNVTNDLSHPGRVFLP